MPNRRIYRTATDKRVQALQRQAQAKARYYEREHGVDITAPKFDVRTMSGSQKLAAIRQLEHFKKQQWVAGVAGTPIPRDTARELQRTIKQVNKRAYEHLQKYANVKLQGDMTVGNFTFMRYGDHLPTMMPQARTNAPGEYAPIRRSPGGFKTEAAMRRYIDTLKQRLTRGYKNERSDLYQQNMGQMIKDAGSAHILDSVNALTNEQRDVLFNMTPFMAEIKFIYEGEKSPDHPGRQEVAQRSRGKAAELIDAVRRNV